MDETTLKMLADEVEESAEWFGKEEAGITAYNVGIGRVAGIRRLSRDNTTELIGEVNRRLRMAEQEHLGQNLIQSAIRNVN